MNTSLHRGDNSVLGRWWWTVDRQLLFATMLLILCGIIMIMAAGTPVAKRIGAPSNYFISHHLMVLPAGLLLLFGTSLLSPLYVRRLAVIGLLCSFLALLATLLIGVEIKGARRWINLGFFSLQASEFLKPALAVVCAWMFAEWRKEQGFKGWLVAIVLFAFSVLLLMLQPDFGMTSIVTAVWFTQFFISGMPLILVIIGIPLMVLGGVGIYHLFPHVQSRINRFLDPDSGDTYQITQSLKAFKNGGWFGQGPGEGRVKLHLPDAHADFIFSVLGEEFGIFACLLLIALFVFIFYRGVRLLLGEKNLFVLLAAAGLLTQFMLQAFVNIASSISLIPTKGMTLPFISYGGSSLLAMSWAMGMILALTRKRTSSRMRE
jgi:cell division protein FtsW